MPTESSDSNSLAELPDPALISSWALARVKVALNPGDCKARDDYAALRSEYQRRMNGARS